MALTTPEVIAGGALVVSVGGYLWNRFGFFTDIKKDIAAIDTRLSKQELKMDLFWPTVGEAVKNMLKQTTQPRKDVLLDKFPDVDKNEIKELKDILMIEKRELVKAAEFLSSDKKIYLIALALMLAGIDSLCIDRRITC